MRLLRPLAAALLLALAACSTQGDGGATATGGGAGGTGGGGGAVTSTPIGGGAAGLREALARDGVTDRVLFGYDSAELTPDARRMVERWAQLLRQYPSARVAIEGHCDERGTREYNLALGERRAAAVKTYLVGLGIPAQRLETISYGKEKPAVLGSTEQSWAQNRRGVLVVE
jgi:peptidoglycan-associated lipoprotein